MGGIRPYFILVAIFCRSTFFPLAGHPSSSLLYHTIGQDIRRFKHRQT